jgi:hypothetical protein
MLYIQVIVVSAAVLGLDMLLASKENGSLLIGLLFWAGIAQGLIALTAAADLSRGKWVTEIKPYLQEYYPLLLIFPLTFLAYARHVSAYEWSHHGNAWLSPAFFIVRNVIALLLPFVFAHIYVRASRKESEKTGFWAVMYIAIFVISQSFMAYDQVMTFDYPWINTLMGPFFFVEALYAGIGFSAVLAGFLVLRNADKFKKAFTDFVVMIMGFALLWAGLFYSQYLVIWYGNIPEEVSYIAKRMEMPFIPEMGLFTVFTIFVIPFVVFISRKMKRSFPVVIFITLLVFAGLIVERLIYLLPVAHLGVLSVSVPLIVLGLPFIYLLFTQYKSLATEK